MKCYTEHDYGVKKINQCQPPLRFNCGEKTDKKISKTSKSHIIEFLRAHATTDVNFLFRTFRSYTCSFSEGVFTISPKPWFPLNKHMWDLYTGDFKDINSSTFHESLWKYLHKFAKGNLDTHTTLKHTFKYTLNGYLFLVYPPDMLK